MEQIPSRYANRFSASKKLPAFYGTPRFITAFTSARLYRTQILRAFLNNLGGRIEADFLLKLTDLLLLILVPSLPLFKDSKSSRNF
jgi:hypothetical protein